MNEAKFTKGPMYYEPSSGYVRQEETDAAVLQVFDNDGHVNPDYVKPLPQAANGYLHAAAPKMYEALEAMLVGFDVDGSLVLPIHKADVMTGRAALAKARGES